MEEALREASSHLTEDDVQPTRQAQRETLACLSSVGKHWPQVYPLQRLPLPYVSTGGDGEVSCDWEHGDRSLALVFYPDGGAAMSRGRMERGMMADQLALWKPSTADVVAAIGWVCGASTWIGKWSREAA